MSRRAIDILAPLIALGILAPAVGAQEPGEPDQLVERYLRDMALDDLLAAQLRERMERATGDERVDIAQRLGAIYTRDLVAASTAEERVLAEARARELLRSMPDGQLFDLRVGLAITLYIPAEETVERWRLLLAGENELGPALSTMLTVREELDEVKDLAGREVAGLERRERSSTDSEREGVRIELAEARRVRSLAHYYSGWSSYYIALARGGDDEAAKAIADFAFLLDTPERRPTTDRLPRRLLQFDHVARAAVGIALAFSIEGRDSDAIEWLDALSEEGLIAPEARDQLDSAWIVVLSHAGDWSQLRRRVLERIDRRGPLDEGSARLLAVVALSALESDTLSPSQRQTATALASTAIENLGGSSRTAHLLDLAGRFRHVPLTDAGFLMLYARGIRAYEDARAAHERSGASMGEPAANVTLARRYDEAAAQLERAMEASDAGKFGAELETCRLRLGTCLFYADELVRASEIFDVLRRARDPNVAEEAAWMRVVSLDLAASGDTKLTSARDEAARDYIQDNPQSERSARLLMRLADADLLSDKQAADVLASLDPSSSLAGAARRHESRLRYRVFRSASPDQREEAGRLFLAVAEPLLDVDLKAATTGEEPGASEAAAALRVRARQVLDVVLSVEVFDVSMADRAIRAIETLATSRGESLDELEGELTYRRLQIALRRGQMEEAGDLIARLDTIGGRFSDSAHRLLYARAVETWAAPPRYEGEARALVRHGVRVIEQLRQTDPELVGAQTLGVMDAVADAAAYLAAEHDDELMRDLAIELDRAVLDAGRRPESVLRRYASLTESVGRFEDALEAWLTLMAGLESGSGEWLRARYESIRLLLVIDPTRAKATMDQFRVLYPGTLPPPWDEKFYDLEAKVRLAAPTPAHPMEEGGG